MKGNTRGTIGALSILAATSLAQTTQYQTTILTQNAKAWSADIEFLEPKAGFVPTEGLSVRGEIGWHAHGTGDLKDTDIDLAIIIESTATIDPSYTTMVLWGLPMSSFLTAGSKYEYGYLAYKPASQGVKQVWDLR